MAMLLLAMAAACAPGSDLTPDDLEKNEPETEQAPDLSAETVLPDQITGGDMTPESEPETQETKRPEMPTLRAQPAPGKGSPTSTTRGNVFPDGYDVVGWDAKTGEKALNVTGMLPTPCHQIRFDVSEPDDANRIEINLYSTSDPDLVCQIGEQDTFQVVNFMLENAGQPARGLNFDRFAIPVLAFDHDRFKTVHIPDNVWDGETTFNAIHLFIRVFDNFRIHQYVQLRFNGFILFITKFHHDQPFRNSNLRRGQANAGRLAHGFYHVINQFLKIPVKVRHFPCLAAQDGIRDRNYFT